MCACTHFYSSVCMRAHVHTQSISTGNGKEQFIVVPVMCVKYESTWKKNCTFLSLIPQVSTCVIIAGL